MKALGVINTITECAVFWFALAIAFHWWDAGLVPFAPDITALVAAVCVLGWFAISVAQVIKPLLRTTAQSLTQAEAEDYWNAFLQPGIGALTLAAGFVIGHGGVFLSSKLFIAVIVILTTVAMYLVYAGFVVAEHLRKLTPAPVPSAP